MKKIIKKLIALVVLVVTALLILLFGGQFSDLEMQLQLLTLKIKFRNLNPQKKIRSQSK